MKNTRITLKNISFSERLSKETNAFAADVYLDGKKFGYAENDGHGGCTNVMPHEGKREEFKEANTYAELLPSTFFKTLEIKSNLENVVDNLMEEWLDTKAQKKFENDMNKGLIIGKDRNYYQLISWTGHTITTLLKHPQGVDAIRKAVVKYKDQGILNTNLPKEVLG